MRRCRQIRIVNVVDEPRLRIADAVLAVAAAAAMLALMAGVDADPGDSPFDALAGVLVVVAAAGLGLRRRAPMAALAVTTAAVVLYGLRDHPGGAVYLTVIVAMFAVSVARGPSKAWVPASACTVLLLVTTFC